MAGGRRARASGAGHAAAPQPAPRSGRAPGSGRRRLAAAACAQPPSPRARPPEEGVEPRPRGPSAHRIQLPPTSRALGFGVGGRPAWRPPPSAGSSLPFGREIVARLLPGAGGALTLDGAEGTGGRAGPRHKVSLLQSQQLGLGGAMCRPGARDSSLQVLGSRSLATRSGELGWRGEDELGAGPEEPRPQPRAAPTFLPGPRPCPALGCRAATPTPEETTF